VGERWFLVVGCQLKTCPMFVPKDYSQGEIALNLSYGLGLHHQPSTINHQPSTINHQPSTINHQLTTNN
jgi:hypothetical protein